MDKTSFKIFIFCLIFSIFIFGVMLTYSLISNKEEKIEVEYVDNPIMFFTVESCVNKYVRLIYGEDKEAIYNVIDEEFKKENTITTNNVLAINIQLDSLYYFKAQEMLEDINIPYRYYVRGYLFEDAIDEYINEFGRKRLEYELIVILDVENSTYTIIPSEVGDYFEAI